MATKKTASVTLHHPTIPGLSLPVSPAAVPDWLAQGWLETAPKATTGRNTTNP